MSLGKLYYLSCDRCRWLTSAHSSARAVRAEAKRLAWTRKPNPVNVEAGYQTASTASHLRDYCPNCSLAIQARLDELAAKAAQ